MKIRFFVSALFALLLPITARAAEDVVFADFEGTDYAGWTAAGTAFGSEPAQGTLPGQMAVEGFAGRGLVNSFHNGDKGTGRLTSPEFKIERRWVGFLIGGGGFAEKTCVNLLVGGKVVRTATGPNVKPGGSERLERGSWEVAELAGKTARMEIVDEATGGWGHVNVDQIVFTDAKPPQAPGLVKKEIAITQRYLHFPVKTGAAKHKVRVVVDGKVERMFDIELAEEKADWLAPLDAGAWQGRTVTVEVDRLTDDSGAWALMTQAATPQGQEGLYSEPLRPQLHFSPARGWTNDPNGCVYFGGEYHLFFQHNPYGWAWGNMTWGHAVSPDLLHWREMGDVLHEDAFGPMFSGSAVVDARNTSGFGSAGKPPLVLLYTAAGHPTVQCAASSTDGRTFAKYSGNPVVKEFTDGNRDPKVIWHEPTHRWVMVLYVGREKKHTVQILTSPNLRDWTPASVVDGGMAPDSFLYECPDFFELPVNGDAKTRKWVLLGANSEYVVGRFDGTTFTPETGKLPGQQGRNFYAPQTFSDEPKGRRVQIGWMQAATPGMPFNQCMSVPMELGLVSTEDGPRMTRKPVAEWDALSGEVRSGGTPQLLPGAANPFAGVEIDHAEVRIGGIVTAGTTVVLDVRGTPVTWNADTQELTVGPVKTKAPLAKGRLDLHVIVDRSTIEVFTSGGLVYVPLAVLPAAGNKTLSLKVEGAAGAGAQLDLALARLLQPVWPGK